MDNLLPSEIIEDRIYVFRGKKVMLDRDLARLYGVETMRLNEAVRRNAARFPEEFSFQLTKEEFANLISQIAISSWGGRRHSPHVFTEYGIAMLSGLLKSKKAITINIQIIKTFIHLRDLALENTNIQRKIEMLEKHYDEQFKIVFDALRRMMTEEEEKPKIEFTKN